MPDGSAGQPDGGVYVLVWQPGEQLRLLGWCPTLGAALARFAPDDPAPEPDPDYAPAPADEPEPAHWDEPAPPLPRAWQAPPPRQIDHPLPPRQPCYIRPAEPAAGPAGPPQAPVFFAPPWTHDEDMAILAAGRSGDEALEAVAVAVGRTPEAVRRRCDQLLQMTTRIMRNPTR